MSQAAARADNTTIAAAPSNSPQSQIAAMQGAVATINPQGVTARFVLADIKGKDAATAFRTDIIRTAILELFKGNPRNLKEAIDLTAQLGKGKKARAYAAGFEAISDARPLERVSARWMDEANADLRTHADAMADAYVLRFASAHATVMAEKAAPKAKKEPAPAPQADTSAGSAEGSAEPVMVETSSVEEMDVATVMAAAADAIRMGMATADEVDAIRAVLAALDEGLLVAPALLAAPQQQPAMTH